MADQIILERAQEIDKYTTGEILRLDIPVSGAALEALLERFVDEEDSAEWVAEDGSDEI